MSVKKNPELPEELKDSIEKDTAQLADALAAVQSKSQAKRIEATKPDSNGAVDLRTLKAGDRIEVVVPRVYEAVAYARYDGHVSFLLSVDGVDQGSMGPRGLESISKEWQRTNKGATE